MEPTAGTGIGKDVFEQLRRRAPNHRGFALRMVPMIDLIFLLLIFFLVTAKWRPQEGFLPLQLAAAQAGDGDNQIGRPEPLEIRISSTPSGCRVRIGSAQAVLIDDRTIETDLAGMIEKTEACLVAEKRFAADPVEIICSGEVRWEHLAKIYNVFFGAGLTDIIFRMTE